MSEQIFVTFVDSKGDEIFSANVDCAPRIGEEVQYRSGDSGNAAGKLEGKTWTVAQTHHEFRHYSSGKIKHILFVTLKRKS